MSMAKHQKQGKGEEIWLTPPEIIDDLGPFDLDPCFSDPRPWDTAKTHYGVDAAGGFGGLHASWHGFVWCNPPYGTHTGEWLAKCADHGDAIALIFARTETSFFFSEVWAKADAVLFIDGRLFFHDPQGIRAKANSGAPSCLVAYGARAAYRLRETNIKGKYIHLKGGEA